MSADVVPIGPQRIVLALRKDGSIDIIADRPCKVYMTGGLAGMDCIEMPPARIGWALVTAVLDEAMRLEVVARIYEGVAPCDTEAGL